MTETEISMQHARRQWIFLFQAILKDFFYMLTDQNDAQIREWFGSLAETGKYEVNDEVKKVLKEEFFGGYCDDDQTKATISEIYKNIHIHAILIRQLL